MHPARHDDPLDERGDDIQVPRRDATDAPPRHDDAPNPRHSSAPDPRGDDVEAPRRDAIPAPPRPSGIHGPQHDRSHEARPGDAQAPPGGIQAPHADDRPRSRSRDDDAAFLRRHLEALLAGAQRRVAADEMWLYLLDPDMPPREHGWKLRVSTRAEELAETLRLVVPVLLRHTCDAKFAVSPRVLRDLNSGERDPRLVGKAVTVYPRAQDFVVIAHQLADALAGRTGPRVLSDRRVRSGSPVYYRYGPFRATGAEGSALVMTGPDGRTFAARAGARYRQPPWAEDPFGRPAPGGTPSAPLVGGRFRISTGIARSPRGDVLRGVDTVTGAAVVVKQARAHMAEDARGVDARGRLRHEHRVLAALGGVEGVPRLVDHLRHGEDEYLVMSDCGPVDLRRDVLHHGPYAARGDDAARQVSTLARQLLVILDAIHARAVVVGDLKPHNVVLGPDGCARVVDFGISALADHRPAGATRGYSLPVYRPDAEPDPADDLYALGATLHFALTGMDPVVIDPERTVNRDRTLACLAAAAPGPALRPVRRLIAGLMSLDAAERTLTARRFTAGLPALPGTSRRPAPPRLSPALLDEVIGHTVATSVAAAPGLCVRPGTHHPGSSLTLYAGAAGVGLELLHHMDRPGVPQAVDELARQTARHPELPRLNGALYIGRTGIDVFLGAVTRSAVPSLGAPPPHPPPPDETGDQIGGAAGTGTGHLVLAAQAEADGRRIDAARHLATAAACAAALLTRTADPAHEPSRADPGIAPSRPASSSDAAYELGFAHGTAGVAHFLYALQRVTADPVVRAAACTGIDTLAARFTELLAVAERPEASRRFGSWCRGLTGIAALLIEAGVGEQDAELLAVGLRGARTCHRIAPRMSPVSQCCGLSGVGDLLVDAALATGDESFWYAAEDVASLVLARSGGTVRRPLFPDNTLTGSDMGWATGSAGVLTFLRRLRDRDAVRLWAPPGRLPS
ncbi:class IV lanthionine synthetase LanL [Streptomyces sp. NBC_00083]|uniref:class IV lanthionine synthetase LanL n=1 Tax=Streptomyces sp. NBC_00083 TaxID=2975647 RepID=UPI00224DEB1D|nr:class IV lanthionine synthetase LanL [Streptomyces sp. NBC_00083]MCX5384514.1 class IV lanthionine synthetase LanL [Streptomyces sp. NBC_00083]